MLQRSLDLLATDPLPDTRWAYLDSAAKRFELAFEYTWKAFKIALDYLGDEVYGPRDTITAAGRRGWIESLEQWSAFLIARNAGTHEYHGLDPEEYARIGAAFLDDARRSLARCTVE